jgi:putative FmdB family regulatory protein
MPTYAYLCPTCQKEFTVVQTIKEHEEHPPVCPTCGSKEIEAQMGTFFAKTSRKS